MQHATTLDEVLSLRDENARLLSILMRYRYAVAFAAAEAWAGTAETRDRFEWARASDRHGNLSDGELAGVGAEFHRTAGL